MTMEETDPIHQTISAELAEIVELSTKLSETRQRVVATALSEIATLRKEEKVSLEYVLGEVRRTRQTVDAFIGDQIALEKEAEEAAE